MTRIQMIKTIVGMAFFIFVMQNVSAQIKGTERSVYKALCPKIG